MPYEWKSGVERHVMLTREHQQNSLKRIQLGNSNAGGRVELIGIGGAGKSTLISQMAKLGASLPVIEVQQPSKQSVLARTAEIISKVASQAPTETIASLATYGGWFLFGKLGYRLASQRQIEEFHGIVADSGLLQPIITHAIRFGEHSPVPLQSILNSLPLPAAVLVVDCETETAFERFVKREIGLNRLKVWGKRDDLRSRFDYAASRSAAIQEWCLHNGIPVEHIDCTSQPSEQQVHALSAKLMRGIRTESKSNDLT